MAIGFRFCWSFLSSHVTDLSKMLLGHWGIWEKNSTQFRKRLWSSGAGTGDLGVLPTQKTSSINYDYTKTYASGYGVSGKRRACSSRFSGTRVKSARCTTQEGQSPCRVKAIAVVSAFSELVASFYSFILLSSEVCTLIEFLFHPNKA